MIRSEYHKYDLHNVRYDNVIRNGTGYRIDVCGKACREASMCLPGIRIDGGVSCDDGGYLHGLLDV